MIQRIINIFSKHAKIILPVFLCCIVFVLFAWVNPVFAADPNPVMVGVVTLLGWIAYFLSYVVGFFATVIIDVLIWVVQFNNIIDVEAVKVGWVIVRDLSNMFFVLVLLVIAFATILRIESYNAKKLLPKLLIMAILINFSKTIFGLIIDFSQVIMLTFVNGFAETGTGRFVAMFQMDKYLSMENIKELSKGSGSALSVAAGILMGLMAMIISVIVLLVLLGVLIMRVIMLWVYTILSPFVFFGFAFPPMQKYFGKIWEDFIKQVVVGPILVFFIWLALLTAGTSSGDLTKQVEANKKAEVSFYQGIVKTPNTLFSTGNFQSYIITIALLIGGLMVTQSMGGAAGAMAGKGMAWAKKVGVAPVAGLGKLSKNIGGWAVDKASIGAGVDLNVVRGYKRFTQQMDINKQSRESQVYKGAVETAETKGRFRGALAHLSTGDLAWESIRMWKEKGADGKRFAPIKRAFMGGEKFQEKQKTLGNELKGMEEEREDIVTSEEKEKAIKDLDKKKEVSQNIQNDISALGDGLDKETISKREGLRNEKQKLDKIISKSEEDINNKTVDDQRAQQINNDIKEKRVEIEQHSELEITGAAAARAQSDSELESLEGKVIANIDNNDQLGKMFKDALKNQRTGLASAIAKKMTKNGDYNELMKHMDCGTGLKGFEKLKGKLTNSGFSDQSAMSLMGDMGQLAKNIGHFGAFGAVTMDQGKFRMSKEDEYEEAKLAEMMKMQPQQYARNVNRLGLGYYEPAEGETHNKNNWKLSKAAAIYIKLNGEALAKNYTDTGQQNALEHLALQLDKMEKAGLLKKTDKVYQAINNRAGGQGADTGEMIKSTNL